MYAKRILINAVDVDDECVWGPSIFRCFQPAHHIALGHGLAG